MHLSNEQIKSDEQTFVFHQCVSSSMTANADVNHESLF